MKILAGSVLTLAALAAIPAQAQSFYDCSLLVGTWEGDYTYENGAYNLWRATYYDDGTLKIDFYDAQGAMLGDQTGIWVCDGVWVTDSVEEQGEWYEYKYRIRQLNDTTYIYESTQGPVFTSHRVAN